MKKLILYILILVTSFCSYSQNDTISHLSEAADLQRHANTYFWFATESNHRLNLYAKAKEFCEKSNHVIITNDLTDSKSKELFTINQSMLANIEEIEGINNDNMNGRYPIFNEIMNISLHHVFLDDPLDLSIEASIQSLGKQLKGSKSIFDFTYFTVIESNYDNPGLIEVMRQAITESSCHYVINQHEIMEILGENKTNFNSENLSSISRFYNTNQLGVINVTLVDSIDNIYYNSCSFSEYSVSSNKKTQIAYAEAFKKDITSNSTNKHLFYLLVIVSLIMIFLFLGAWRGVSWFHYFFMSISISYFITFFLVLCLRAYELDGSEYYLETDAITWRIVSAVIFSLIPLILTYIAIIKVKFLLEEVNKPSSIIAIIYGVCISSLIYFISLDIFEYGITNNLYTYFIIAILLFIPSQTSGRIASKLLINQRNINLIPLFINLLVITYVFYVSILKHSVPETLALMLPVTVFSLIPFYFEPIIESITTRLKIADVEPLESTLNHPLYIKPNQFDTKIQKIDSSEILHVNIITGIVGSGKTRLVREIGKLSKELYYGNCDKETSVIEYEPFVEAFINLGAGTFEDQSAKAKILEKGAKAIMDKSGAGGQVLSAIISGDEKEEIRDKKYIIKAITDHLKKQVEPVIIAIEDLNNIDEHSLELLKNLIYEIGLNYHEYNTVSLLLTSTELDLDNKNNALYFLKELDANEIISNNTLFRNIHESYNNFLEEFLRNLNLEYESEVKIKEFLLNDDTEISSPLHLVELIKLIDTYKMFNHEGKLSLIKNANLKTLPKPQAMSGIYQEEIKALDTELFNILECAAYIGKSFEADVIVHIINKDRLDILNRLREAEDIGFINDKSDEDDIFEFTSRVLMKEIRSFGISKNRGDSDVNVSQIVKEYNERVINYYYTIDENFNLENININLLISLANRSFENNYYRKSMNVRCASLNKVAGERTFSLGKYQNALKMFQNLYKLADRFNDEKLELESLLFIIKCHINLEEINKALDLKDQLSNYSSFNEFAVERNLLVAKLCLESSHESDAYEILDMIQNDERKTDSQEIRYKILLAELHDHNEEDDKAIALYIALLQNQHLESNTKIEVLYHLCDIHVQHSNINEAYHFAQDGYKLSCQQDDLGYQAKFLYELLTISLKKGNKIDLEKYKEQVLKLSELITINITHQLSSLLSKFVEYVNHSIEYSEISPELDRLLKMVRYTKNQQKEIQVFILKIIVSVLEGDCSNCTTLIEDKYLSHHDIEGDLRMKFVLTLLYTDLSVLKGEADYKYLSKIEESKLKEIPTLLPKFNFLISLRDGANIMNASKNYFKEINHFDLSDIYLLTEELPLSIKLSNDKVLIDDILQKYFLTDRLRSFLNG